MRFVIHFELKIAIFSKWFQWSVGIIIDSLTHSLTTPFRYSLTCVYEQNHRRFGFPNLRALEEGRSGTDCRGEEHEVVVVWSVTSGKRQILMDGREVHYSANRVGILDFSWNTKGNHVLKVTCHAAPPMSATPGFRQYDLFIDGQSFFNMPKVYELGIKGVSAAENRMPGQYGYEGATSPRSLVGSGGYGGGGGGYGAPPPAEPVHVPRTESEEDEDLKKAIAESLKESKQHLGEGAAPDVLSGEDGSGKVDLLDFGGPSPAPAPPAQQQMLMSPAAASTASFVSAPQPTAVNYDAYGSQPPQQQQQQQQFAALPPSTSYGAPPPAPAQYGSPPPQQQYAALPPSTNYGAPAPAPPSNYGLPPTQPNYGAAPAPVPPVQTQTSYGAPDPYNQAFGGGAVDDPFAPKPPAPTDMANDILKAYSSTAPTSQPVGGFESPQSQYQPGQPFTFDSQGQPQQNGQQPGLSMNGLAITEGEEEPQNPFDKVLKKLVNIDHIDEPAEEQMKLSMKKQEDEKAKKNKNRSVPIPPAASRMVGSGATLGEISKVKPHHELKPVMAPPANLFQGDAAAAGMLVVHGQGPPPLQPRGFGMVHGQGQYYGTQQQGYGQQQRQQGYGYR